MTRANSTRWMITLSAMIALGGRAQPADGGPGQEGNQAAMHFPGEALVNMSPTFLAGVGVDRDNRTYLAGDAMRVEFGAERDAHLYLLYHQADGSTRLLFPNVSRRDNRIANGAHVSIPGPEDKFRFRAGPPFGVEVLQTIAASAPIPELDALIQAPTPAAVVPAQTIAGIAQRLQQSPGDWTENHVDIVTAPLTGAPSAMTAARCGVFIGVGEYLHPEFASTQAPLRRSAEVMHAAMLKQGGLDPEKTKLVTDKQATRAKIQELIYNWLPSVSHPGDVVLVYYSGHAGQDETGDPTEPDGKDETIAPYDLNAGDERMSVAERRRAYQASKISDDELARWLQALQGRQVVLIFDTCHSGGYIEGKDLFDNESRRVKDISQLNVLVLASCGADEQTLFEGTPDQTMWFTYFLAQAVNQGRPLTVQQAFSTAQQGVREVIKKRNEARIQEPIMSDRALLPVFLVPPPKADAGVSAQEPPQP